MLHCRQRMKEHPMKGAGKMSLFKKEPPMACPKCGKADGWHLMPIEAPQDYVNTASAVNSFSSAPIRNTFGQNLTGTMGKKSKKLRYHCDSCGYEKAY